MSPAGIAERCDAHRRSRLSLGSHANLVPGLRRLRRVAALEHALAAHAAPRMRSSLSRASAALRACPATYPAMVSMACTAERFPSRPASSWHGPISKSSQSEAMAMASPSVAITSSTPAGAISICSIVVMDNRVYGMTKGQPSPTTEADWD